MVLLVLTSSRVASKGRKGGLTENKLVLSQFREIKSAFHVSQKKKKTFLTRVYVIYDFTVAFVVSSLENPQGAQGSSDEEIEETADERCANASRGNRNLSKLPP